MEKEYHKGHALTMADLGLSLEDPADQPLELLAREGERLLLTLALEEKMTEFLQLGAMSAARSVAEVTEESNSRINFR